MQLGDMVGNGREQAERLGVIGFGGNQQLQQFSHKGFVVSRERQLAGPHRLQLLLHRHGKSFVQLIELTLGRVISFQQGAQGSPEHPVVGLRGCRLVEKGEVGPTTGPGLEAWIKQFTEAEGAVVEGVSTGSAVVAVEVALAVADSHPAGDQGGESTAEQSRQLKHLLMEGQRCINLSAVIAVDQVLHNQPQLVVGVGVSVVASAASKQFDLPHP